MKNRSSQPNGVENGLNMSQTSKSIIGNTFWNSISDIRITFKKVAHLPPKRIPIYKIRPPKYIEHGHTTRKKVSKSLLKHVLSKKTALFEACVNPVLRVDFSKICCLKCVFKAF